MNQHESSPRTAASSANIKREVFALRAYSFSAYSIQALLVSFIPLYFLSRGISEQGIGLIYSTGLFVSIFANLLTGLASDKLRTIRKILSALLLGQLLAMGALFSLENFSFICATMALFYFCQTPMNPLSDSLILLSSQHTGTPYALIRIFGSLGFAVSAFGFGLLLKEIGSEWTILVAICTISISLLLSLFLKDYQGKASSIQFSGFFKLLRQKSVIIFFGLVLLVSISHRMYESFLAVTLRHIGASDSQIGLALLVSAVSEIPVLFLLGKYGHKLRELPLLVFASLMYALRLWLLSEIEDPRWLVLTQAMHSISFGIYFATALRYISGLIPDEFRASGQAVYTIIWTGVAGIISGVLGGMIYEQLGKAVFYQTATGIALLAAIGFFLYSIRRNRQ
ncbi:MFS transporter [Paenibacillus oryzae]|uniref:MFS transporter n=1 Tax=Paenibacillus oryzae TaxID=1844972 RepID=A0A1A5YP59_9BACL|nr:MFS transporter [Paenibacillus oryzae]OBR67397.1 MFS transporter [Paenibacillus oryzae]